MTRNQNHCSTIDVPNNGDDVNTLPLGSKFFNLRTFVSFGVAFAILIFVFKQMDIDYRVILGYIASANPFYYAVALLVYYSAFIVRSLRWRILLENVGFGDPNKVRLPSVLGTAEIIFLSWFANCIMPAKLGDAYRAYLLKHNASVSFSKTFGTILAERILDLLLTFVLLAATGMIAFHGSLPPSVQLGMQASIVLVAAVIAGLMVMRNMGSLIRRIMPHKLHRYYNHLEEGTLGSFQQLPLVLAYSLMAWIIEASRLYFVVLALGLGGISFPIILFAAIAGSLLTSLPGTPAGLGFVEGAIMSILVISGSIGLVPGMNESLAASVAILDRTISYWSLVVFGLIAYILTKKK